MLLPFFFILATIRCDTILSYERSISYQRTDIFLINVSQDEDSQRAQGIVRLNQFRHRAKSSVCWLEKLQQPSEHSASQTITGTDRFGYAYDRSGYKIIGQRD